MYLKYAVVFLILGVGVGFYFTISEIVALKEEVLTLGDAVLGSKDNPLSTIVSEGKKQAVAPISQTTSTEPKLDGSVNIPTAIIFTILSDQVLQPQANISVTIENAYKKDGDFVLNLRAFTNEAQSYSAIDFKDVFKLINFEKGNEKPYQINGKFSSMPPKSVVNGSVFIKPKPSDDVLILQIETKDGNFKHYEFDFKKKTYKEKEIG